MALYHICGQVEPHSSGKGGAWQAFAVWVPTT